MRHIARESGCFVIGVAPVMHPDWLPDSIPDAGPLRADAEQLGGWLLDGYSVIVDPASKVLAGPLVRERGILIADLDLDTLAARKRLFDATGHYSPRRVPPDRRRPAEAAGRDAGSRRSGHPALVDLRPARPRLGQRLADDRSETIEYQRQVAPSQLHRAAAIGHLDGRQDLEQKREIVELEVRPQHRLDALEQRPLGFGNEQREPVMAQLSQ
jgi:Carbon-nitrogen hydrolase